MKKFASLKNELNEADGNILDTKMAPIFLVLKRRGVRVFPDGRRVALYYNDKYNLVFSVPFGDNAYAVSGGGKGVVMSGQG